MLVVGRFMLNAQALADVSEAEGYTIPKVRASSLGRSQGHMWKWTCCREYQWMSITELWDLQYVSSFDMVYPMQFEEAEVKAAKSQRYFDSG